jgi:hypothetical protein
MGGYVYSFVVLLAHMTEGAVVIHGDSVKRV